VDLIGASFWSTDELRDYLLSLRPELARANDTLRCAPCPSVKTDEDLQ